MTKADSAPTENYFVTRRLPWWLCGVAGLFYLLTLNPWISLDSLETITRLAGWQWQPEVGRPLTWLVFAPLKLLPIAWLPWLANLITAAVAALVLQQLARSVAILRQDIAPEDRLRKKQLGPMILCGPLAWLPPVMAVAVCGLQLGFWEHATAASGEMLSLLGFAAAFRCVLEYRIEPHDKWLYRGALSFALGMTDNWVMGGYLPAFIAAVIWVKGYWNCIDGRFLLRMSAAAVLGLSLYLLVPGWLVITRPDEWNFWLALKAELAAQKHALHIFRLPAMRVVVLTAGLPFGLLAVKWRSHSAQLGDDTRFGVFISKASGHLIHALLFLGAIWVALQSSIVPRTIELGASFLIYQYTWALVVGHCAGYLLLFGRTVAGRGLSHWSRVTALLLVFVIPAGLLGKNVGAIRLTNSGAIRDLVRQRCDDLPSGRIMVLSDEPGTLALLRAELAARGRTPEVATVDARLLPSPAYQKELHRIYGARWPEVTSTNLSASLEPAKLQAAVLQVAATEAMVYAHPSSGFFFEFFTSTPHGWIQLLTPRAAQDSPLQPIGAQIATANEQLWQQRWTNQLAARAKQLENYLAPTTAGVSPVLKALRLTSDPSKTAVLLAGAYSKMLNSWGVQAQRAGRWTEAEVWFQRALSFDLNNLSACINRAFATRRARGEVERLTMAWLRQEYPQLLARYDRWAEVIGRNGPVDEPTFLFHTGRMWFTTGNLRQASAAFERSAMLATNWVAPKLAWASCLNALDKPAAALMLTEEKSIPVARLDNLSCAYWLQARSVALWRLGRTNEALSLVNAVATQRQEAPIVVLTAAEFLMSTGNYLEELKWREWLARRDPTRLEWVVKKGHAELRAGQFEAAITTLNQALTMDSKSASARLFRAVAALQAGKLEAARRDYQELLQNPAQLPTALFGLGSIAWRERDTNAMLLYYQAFLTNAVVNPPQAALVNQRLKDWQDE